MEISGTGPLPPSTTLRVDAAASIQFRMGQILAATVLGQAQPNQAQLIINGQQLTAYTNVPVQAGQTLQVEVARLVPEIQLRLLNTLTQSSAYQAALRAVLPQQQPLPPLLSNLIAAAQPNTPPAALLPMPIIELARQIISQLPRAEQLQTAEGIRQALNQSGVLLETHLQHAGRERLAPPADFKNNLLQLWQQLQNRPEIQTALAATNLPTVQPTPGLLTSAPAPPSNSGGAPTPENLRQFMSQVNLLLSNYLSNAGGNLRSVDYSNALLMLWRVLSVRLNAQGGTLLPTEQLTPPLLRGAGPQPQAAVPPSLGLLANMDSMLHELLRQTHGALSRLELAQLASLSRDDDSVRSWTFEIPVVHGEGKGELVHFILEQRKQPEQENADTWSIKLAFHFADLGPLHAKVSLFKDRIGVTLWAEQESTARLFDQHLPDLYDRLQGAGLQILQLRCQHGAPADASPDKPADNVLIDERA